jgi:RimJ/RimL family protein N-acetyltransferase
VVTEDIPAFREMRLEALRLHPEAFGADYQQSEQQPQEYWLQRLASNPYRTTFVAEADGQLIGMTGVLRGEMPKTAHTATIISVYVRSGWRGLHLIDALIEECLNWSREKSIRVVKLAVVANNTPAIRSYIRCGFSVYGVEPESLCVDGRYHDELLMVRRL